MRIDIDAPAGFSVPRSLHGQLVDAVGRDIVRGHYPAGETIDLAALQAEQNVSKTALREALRVLGAKGLVDARQKRGTIVPPRSDWDLLDPDVLRWQVDAGAGAATLDALAEVRAIVEPAAARLAAERRSEADLEALGAALATMVDAAGDAAAHAAADVTFHRVLVAASGNELLARIGAVFESVLRARDELVHGAEVRDDFRAPHEAVLEAVRERRPADAEAAMLALLAQSSSDARGAVGTEAGR
jgi:GntR family transcriptional regulator, galactonate operon transcriptional repressor